MPACPDAAELDAFLAGRADDARQAWLETHLTTCAACTAALTRLGETDPLVQDVRRAATEQPSVPRVLRQLMSAAKAQAAESRADSRFASTMPIDEPGGTYPFLAPPQSADELGRLGPYRVLRLIGSGGMGLVFHAEDVRLGRPAALKVLKPRAGGSEERFLREARAAALLRHDHIVTVYQVGNEGSVPYLAMELLEGETLAARLQRERTLPPAEALRVAREIAAGLAAAHAKGCVHRDVKPENVWLDAGTGRAKLLDFGLALLAENAGAERLTHEGMILGTPAYMAPEQARGEPAEERSDLFSLGCVLYHALTGTAPFLRKDVVSTLLAVSADTPLAPRRVNPVVGPALSDFTLKLLAKNPAARPASAATVAAKLARIAATPDRPRRRWWWAAAAVLAALAVALPFAFHRPVVPLPPADWPRANQPPLMNGAFDLGQANSHLEQWAVALGVPLDFTNAAGVRLTLIPPGGYRMGGTGEPVLVREPFFVSMNAVTTDDLPAYCAQLSALPDEKRLGRVYRPLTEIEWEYACRAGTEAAFVSTARNAFNVADVPANFAGRGQRIACTIRTPPPLSRAPLTTEQAQAYQKAWAEHLGTSLEVAGPHGLRLALIPPGLFLQGSPTAEAERDAAREPQHQVRITRPFLLGVLEVTREQYTAVTGRDPSSFHDHANLPASSIGYDMALAFCRALSELPAERAAGRRYRLPTEAEWEYAGRAGTETPFFFGSAASSQQADFDGYRPYGGADKGPHPRRAMPVGRYAANAWGLHDTHGSIAEWCADEPRAYLDDPFTAILNDPRGPERPGQPRVVRGGHNGDPGRSCRSAARASETPSGRGTHLGFRIACDCDAWRWPTPPPRGDFALSCGRYSWTKARCLELDRAGPLTLEVFATLDAGAEPYGVILGVGEQCFLHANDGRWNLSATTTQGNLQLHGPWTPGRRTHLAAVRDGDEVRLYVDGRLVSRGLCTGPLAVSPHSFNVSDNFTGSVDEARVSSVARYTTDFTPAARHEPDAHTIALYHFDEGEGNRLIDSSGNNYHGKHYGCRWLPAGRVSP